MILSSLSPISALSVKSAHYIMFQCVRNTSNKSIEFHDSKSCFFRIYSKTQRFVQMYKAVMHAKKSRDSSKGGATFHMKEAVKEKAVLLIMQSYRHNLIKPALIRS